MKLSKQQFHIQNSLVGSKVIITDSVFNEIDFSPILKADAVKFFHF